MNKQQAYDKLAFLGQEHLLKYYDSLPPSEQASLLQQIQRIDRDAFHVMREKILVEPPAFSRRLQPFQDYDQQGNEQDAIKGQELIEQGKVGALLVAGGQGTRLGFSGPKGCYPLTVFQKKSLFQLFAEKTAAASRAFGQALPLAIMTSEDNDRESRAYFKEHRFFGLQQEQLYFFPQGSLPFMTPEGELFLQDKGCLAAGPDGNGAALARFLDSGLWQKWQRLGIRYVLFLPVDNPLADPFDKELIGYQARKDADVVIKCIERKDPLEKVGVIVKEQGKAAVYEYSELPQEEMAAKDSSGSLKHPLANISLFSFQMPFIKEAAGQRLPLHLAFKASPFLNEAGQQQLPQSPNCWKGERFIFDVLPFATSSQALAYPRSTAFAPLKNAAGSTGPLAVQQALQQLDNKILEQITGVPSPSFPFELAQDFYYPTEALLHAWSGKRLETPGYVPSRC